MCTLLPLTYSSLKVNSPHVYGTIEQLLIPFNLCLFFGFRMLVCTYLFTNIWYHQQLTIQSLCFFHVVLFRSQTYHMSLSKILWLHRLRFTMGKAYAEKSRGRWSWQCKHQSMEMIKDHEIIMKPSSIKPFSIIFYQQTNRQINHPTHPIKSKFNKTKKTPGIRNLLTYFLWQLTGFDSFQLSRSKAFPAG